MKKNLFFVYFVVFVSLFKGMFWFYLFSQLSNYFHTYFLFVWLSFWDTTNYVSLWPMKHGSTPVSITFAKGDAADVIAHQSRHAGRIYIGPRLWSPCLINVNIGKSAVTCAISIPGSQSCQYHPHLPSHTCISLSSFCIGAAPPHSSSSLPPGNPWPSASGAHHSTFPSPRDQVSHSATLGSMDH